MKWRFEPRLIAAALAALASLCAPRALAQQSTGFAIDRFDPAERGSDWFSADSLDLRGHGRFLQGVTGDWAYKPLVFYPADGRAQRAVIQNQFFAHLGVAVVLAERLRLGLNLPLAVYQSGDPATIQGTTFRSSSATTLGDLRLSADLRLLGKYRAPVEFAAGLAVFLPTGSRAAFTGDGRARVSPRLLLAGELGPWVYAARVGVAYRANDAGFDGSATGSELAAGGALGLRVADERLVFGPELYGSTNITGGAAFLARRTTPFEVLFGAHYLATRSVRVGAGIGPGLTRGIGAPALRGLVALEWAPVAKPEPTREPAPEDRDHDGVLDAEDACPDEIGVTNADPRKNGCPVASDRDHDGVLDEADACPDEAGVTTDDRQTNGCPAPKDRDHDSVLDLDDACPDETGVRTGDPKTNGCAPPRDRDKDGVLDDQDACPDAPGPKRDDPRKNGCPEARIEHGQIKILERVEFENNSRAIRPVSETVLNAVLDVLKEHTEFTKLAIEGHTDNHGAAAYNKRLSEQRAASVAKWLADHGIARARLSAQGFGLERPIDSNVSEDGRQNNRRVEFHIVEVDGKAVKTP